MTQATRPTTTSGLYGDALLADLQSHSTGLPNKTVLSLVIGALRVRMMRSTVTMVSIVLAIAFLTYMGLSNKLEKNIAEGVLELERIAARGSDDPVVAARAQDEAIEMRRLVLRAGIDVEKTVAGDTTETWLVAMALLTCTVGIANAMLMSVTERFREIATMKCLGALDSLVVKLFLLESSLLGVIGALLGIALGLAVALAFAWLQFGAFGPRFFPITEAGPIVIGSIVAGILLPVLGAVYPAYLASRMRPVDALRVDE